MRIWIVPFAVGGVATLLACSGRLQDSDETDTSRDAIIGGSLAAAYPEAAYLNIDYTASGGYVCSAALIAPKVVLTAGHCVDTHKKWEVHVGKETRISTSSVTYDWNEKGATTVNPNHHDIGLVFLDQAISISSYPTIASAALPSGAKVTNVGRINNGTITNSLYAADSLVTPGSTIGYPYSYASNVVIQPGDSGGPDFAAGTHSIVAVNSGASASIEVLARTDLLRDWILQQIASHGGSTLAADAGSGSDSGAKAPTDAGGVADSGASAIKDAGTDARDAGDAGAAKPTCPADVEPNNTVASAYPLAAGTYCGGLTAGDEDWFRVVASSGALSLSLSGSGDATMSVGQLVGTTCTPSITGMRTVTLVGKAGQTYCFRVVSASRAVQSYSLVRN